MHTLQKKLQPLPVPPEARETLKQIFERLKTLERGNFSSCREPGFKKTWSEILDLIDRHQRETAAASRMSVSCTEECTACCCHWVEDVNSFEAELLADYIRTHASQKIGRIIEQCRRDEEVLKKLNTIVEAKLDDYNSRGLLEEADPVDLLLASFYRLQLPCPLLDNGRCIAYPARPLTCRMYVSFSPPERCAPSSIDNGDVPTYLFDLDEEANRIIDGLHFRFQRFDGNSGLRSLLARALEQDG